MKSLPERQFFILQRFVELSEIPTNSETYSSYKKIVLLKNIYNEQRCIMKIQPKQLLETKQRNVLHQASFFQKFQGHIGVPLMIWSGQDFDCLVLIIQELGFSIYDRLKQYCPTRKMRIKDACMIGIQLLDIIKNLHEKDYLHKNITPETFCFGRVQKVTKLYASDLLYMKKFRAKNSLNHIQQKQNLKLQYLTPFMSKNVLNGKEASRRDDAISIVYVLIYLIKGKLPWQQDWEEYINLKKQQVKQTNLKNDVNFVFRMNPNDYSSILAKIQRMKKIQQSVSSQQLCRQLPRQIKQILDFAYELEFSEQPEYLRYIALLKKILFRLKQKNDHLYEWMQSKENLDTNLLAESKTLKLNTEKQRQILSIVYEPYEDKVDLDNSYEQKLKKSVKPTIYLMNKEKEEGPTETNVKKKKGKYEFQKKKTCQII